MKWGEGELHPSCQPPVRGTCTEQGLQSIGGLQPAAVFLAAQTFPLEPWNPTVLPGVGRGLWLHFTK